MKYLLVFILSIIIYQGILQAQWVKIYTFNGDNLNCFAFTDSIIFAGSQYSGVYLSRDNGTSWIQSNNGLGSMTVCTFMINGNKIFVGLFGAGLFLSTNNGLIGPQ